MKYTEFKTKFTSKFINPKQRLGSLIYTVHAFTIWCELSKKQQEACNETAMENAISEYERLLAWGIPEEEALASVLENFEV